MKKYRKGLIYLGIFFLLVLFLPRALPFLQGSFVETAMPIFVLFLMLLVGGKMMKKNRYLRITIGVIFLLVLILSPFIPAGVWFNNEKVLPALYISFILLSPLKDMSLKLWEKLKIDEMNDKTKLVSKWYSSIGISITIASFLLAIYYVQTYSGIGGIVILLIALVLFVFSIVAIIGANSKSSTTKIVLTTIALFPTLILVLLLLYDEYSQTYFYKLF
mgnify:CR=1 FL=1